MRIDTNNINGTAQPTNPYHIARAYGVQPASRSGPIGQVGAVAPVRGEDAANKLPTAAQALVAGVVPGGVSFREDGPTAQPSAPTLQMYRHPADKNAAATAVQVGRRLDVNG